MPLTRDQILLEHRFTRGWDWYYRTQFLLVLTVAGPAPGAIVQLSVFVGKISSSSPFSYGHLC